jgi:hypothetical protein
MGREEPSDSKPIIDEWGGMGGPWARWGWFEFSLQLIREREEMFSVPRVPHFP